MRRIVARALLALALTFLLVYGVDYLWVRVRKSTQNNPFESVQVERMLVVPQKNGKPQYIQDTPRDQTCVHSLLPHMGDVPCWYLYRHTQQEVKY